ncbi:MAG: DedA family protein [Methyloprofundus sp.]|nr:DedA family protein [Methyloprofundus sp.]MBW6453637.1 DedA family protein [Methyloprofundus sp.]
MEELLQIIQANIQYAHFIIFGALLLAGFNIPVSEDAMLFISAILASSHPEYLVQLFFGVYLGAYFSDLICYSLGRKFGPKLFEIKFFAGMVPAERVAKISAYYHKYGVMTLILGRFIPFGVRNGLFLTAGLGRMNFTKFALSDLLACTISSLSFFSLYYYYGETVIDYIKQGNIVIFSLVLILLAIFWYKNKRVA